MGCGMKKRQPSKFILYPSVFLLLPSAFLRLPVGQNERTVYVASFLARNGSRSLSGLADRNAVAAGFGHRRIAFHRLCAGPQPVPQQQGAVAILRAAQPAAPRSAAPASGHRRAAVQPLSGAIPRTAWPACSRGSGPRSQQKGRGTGGNLDRRRPHRAQFAGFAVHLHAGQPRRRWNSITASRTGPPSITTRSWASSASLLEAKCEKPGEIIEPPDRPSRRTAPSSNRSRVTSGIAATRSCSFFTSRRKTLPSRSRTGPSACITITRT